MRAYTRQHKPPLSRRIKGRGSAAPAARKKRGPFLEINVQQAKMRFLSEISGNHAQSRRQTYDSPFASKGGACLSLTCGANRHLEAGDGFSALERPVSDRVERRLRRSTLTHRSLIGGERRSLSDRVERRRSLSAARSALSAIHRALIGV